MEAREADGLTNVKKLNFKGRFGYSRYYRATTTDAAALLLAAWLKQERPNGPSRALATFQINNFPFYTPSIRTDVIKIGLAMLSWRE